MVRKHNISEPTTKKYITKTGDTYRNITADVLTNECIADDVYSPCEQPNTRWSLELELVRPIIPRLRGIGERDVENAHRRYNDPVRLVISKDDPPTRPTILRFVIKVSLVERQVVRG